MKNKILFTLTGIIFSAAVLFSQPVREDIIWARTIPQGSILMDGVLDEAAWDGAEVLSIAYGQNAGLPTSGWRAEFQPDAVTDPTNATVKFLVEGNTLYAGFNIPDSSIGGTQDWARWDAILMSLKDKLSSGSPAAPVEYFYTYWLAGLPNTTPVVGANPRFIGRYGNFNDTTRTPEQIAAWDARTVINGVSNDPFRDDGWVVEMKFDLGVLGYDVTDVNGDFVMFNMSIWDCDYLFEGDPGKISTTRTHWQSPWGNANGNNVGKIYARPDIGIGSDLPDVGYEMVIPNGAAQDAPVIDGILDEVVWDGAFTFDIVWDDSLTRSTYAGAGPWMSGQWQPEIGGNPRPPVLDPGTAKVKMFFRGTDLYLAGDISDQVVIGSEVYDQMDGLGIILGDRGAKNVEEVMEFRILRVSFASDGTAQPYDYLPGLIDSSAAEFAVTLKGETTVNDQNDVDEGFYLEMKIDLTKLGYDFNLSDRSLFAGVLLGDGDSFDDPLKNYGTRTWFFREHGGGPAAAWGFLDENTLTSVRESENVFVPASINLTGNYPNPFNPSTKIRFSIPSSGKVELKVFNILGEVVAAEIYTVLKAGLNEISFSGSNLSSGLYLYQLNYVNSASEISENVSGKMMLLK
ncbi:MAG: T9SS type A sorting domain-containing protein [Ignavibacteriales bacterium]|nr:T9SS type A sorting domain-containing protein [Ignavibacteriales bacterium]MCF8435577.1 T9SS type A sorting domain-containing protein [Ignavibacteriales bacterium]